MESTSSPNPASGKPKSSSKPKAKHHHKAVSIPKTSSKLALNASAQEFIPAAASSANSHVEDYCLICANYVRFYAVGPCDHHICSLCALRIRSKNNDKNCPICKQNVNHMVVYGAVRGKIPFSQFGLVDDTALPGVDIEHHSNLLFVDCKSHFRDMCKMRSICCPCSGCESRFPAEKLLLKHLQSTHDLVMCTLCLENRPLFISEQVLYTKSQLNVHLNSAPGTLTGAGGDKTGGHPLCRFCNERYFDTPALYKVVSVYLSVDQLLIR